MADRGRDLKIGILSDVSKFDLDRPARDLADLGDAAHDTGRDLADLGDDAGRDLSRLGADAKTAAGKMDNAFDTIARASKATATKVDANTDDINRSLKDVGDEAGGTAKEMAASFSGSADDVKGAFQELAANAGASLGPIGIAAGVAAAAGVGLITAQQEKLKELTATLVQDMLDAGGTLTEAAINTRIQTMATDDPAGFVKFNEQAKAAGISIRDVTRARAGDIEAIARVRAAIDKQIVAQKNSTQGSHLAQRGPIGGLQDLRQELNLTTRAQTQAEAAVATAMTATSRTVKVETSNQAGAFDDLRANLGHPIRVKIDVDAPTQAQLNAIRRGIVQGIGPVVLNPPILPPPRDSIFYPGRYRP